MVEVKANHDTQLGAYVISFHYRKYDWPQVKGVIDIIKVMIPASDREYNPNTKEWTVLENSWKTLKEIMDRASFRVKEERTVRAEDFHYSYTNTTTAVSKDTLAEQLAALLEITLEDLKDAIKTKKAYRSKALAWHPDRNNGDGARMSELNSVWSAYNG